MRGRVGTLKNCKCIQWDATEKVSLKVVVSHGFNGVQNGHLGYPLLLKKALWSVGDR